MILIKKGEVTFAGDVAEEMGDIDTMLSMLKDRKTANLFKIVVLSCGVIEGKIRKEFWVRAAETIERLSEGGFTKKSVLSAWEASEEKMKLIQATRGGKRS